METAQEFSREIVKAIKDEIVEFRFKSKTKEEGPQVIRFLKSRLVEKSAAFRAMFSELWDKNHPIDMDDDVDFDQAYVFGEFAFIVSNLRQVETLSIMMSCDIYYYANKYQIDGLKAELLNHISEYKHAFKLDEFTDCLALAELYQLTEFKAKLNSIKLGLKDELAIGFFDVCSKYQTDKLMHQLVTFLSKKPLEKSWPFDLIALIVDKERKDAEERIRNSEERIKNAEERIKKLEIENLHLIGRLEKLIHELRTNGTPKVSVRNL